MAEGNFVLTRIGQTLVVTLEGIAEIHARQGADSVVLEVSGCEVIDLDEFGKLQNGTMEWLGLRCGIAGLRPGIVAYLASAGISAGSLCTSLDLEHALLELNPSRDEMEPDLKPKYESDDARALTFRLKPIFMRQSSTSNSTSV